MQKSLCAKLTVCAKVNHLAKCLQAKLSLNAYSTPTHALKLLGKKYLRVSMLSIFISIQQYWASKNYIKLTKTCGRTKVPQNIKKKLNTIDLITKGSFCPWKNIKRFCGVQLNKHKVLCAPGLITKYFECFF